MIRRYASGLLGLAATMFVAVHVQAMELTYPGEPELLSGPPECMLEVPLSEEPLAYGRIVAVDRASARIVLEFRPILPFLPEGGTRIFQVADAHSLKGLGPGDKVRFEVERDGRHFTVTHIENSN